MPSSRASRAERRGLRNQISFAFFLPTRSSRYQAPKPASTLPVIGPAGLPRRGSFRTPRGAPVVRLGGSGLAIGCAGPQGHAAPEGGPGMIQELLPQAERIGAILKARGETVSVAESSTASLISAAL